MQKRRLTYIMITALLLVACTDDKRQETGHQATIHVTTSMARVTRTAKYSGLQENALSTDVHAAFYVYREGTAAITSGYGYENLTYDYNTTQTARTHKTVFFPEDWSDVDVFVYAPRVESPEAATIIPITVQEDQSTQAAYIASDFVFGSANVDYAYPVANIDVTLYHALSKLILNFQDVNGATSTLGTLQKVELGTETYPIRLNAYVNITTPVSSAADVAANNAVTTLATYGIITMLDVSKEQTATPWSVACILPPQTLPNEGVNLTLTFSTGNTYAGILEATLTAGCTHTYTITVDQEELTFSGVTVQPWGSGWGNDDAPSEIIY